MNFLKRVLATIVGIFVFIGLCFVMIMIIGAVAGGGSKDKVKVEANTVLELNLDQAIPDYKPKSEEDKIFNELFGKEGHNDCLLYTSPSPRDA